MDAKRVCGQCRAELTDVGTELLCPGCLLEGGLDGSASQPREPGQPPRSQAALESAFPRSFGDYELLEEIGRGGMGIVYKARQVNLDRLVAVKMLLFGPLARPEQVQRFRTEAAAAASLQHPNIVAIHEVGFREGQHFFAMDYVAGRSLAEIVRDGPLTPRRAVDYVRTIAEAIQYAHERGIIHRDLKPSNVLIDASDRPKVMDFGLAKRLEKETELTLSGQVLGSPNYMPPEQAAAHRGLVGKRSDVYSLGAILYHLLTGRAPFVAPTVAETLKQVLEAEPVSPTVLNPHLARDLKTICLKCLEKVPQRRYASAGAVADDLERWLRQEPILARPSNAWGRAVKWARRKPVIAALSMTVALSVTAGFAGVASQWRRADNAKREAELAYGEARKTASFLAVALAQTDAELAVVPLVRSPDGRWILQRSNRVASIFNVEARRLQGVPLEQSSTIRFATFSPDSRRFILALADGTARIWEVQTGKTVGEPLRHNKAINCARFSPDGLRIATGSDDGTVGVWDSRSGQSVMPRVIEINQAILSVRFTSDGRQVIAITAKGLVLSFDARTGNVNFHGNAGSSEFQIKTPTGVIGIRG